MFSPRLLFCLSCIFLTAGMAGVRADNYYALRDGRGLAIYQKHAYASPKTAIVIEYATYTVYPNVTQLLTSGGKRLTVDARRGGYLVLVPYPGKGEATPEEALAVLSVAEKQFPQFAAYYKPLRRAWVREKAIAREIVEGEIAKREEERRIGESFVEWVKTLMPKRQPEIPPSLLDGKPKAAPSASDEADDQAGKDSARSLEENLQTIREYYEANPEQQ